MTIPNMKVVGAWIMSSLSGMGSDDSLTGTLDDTASMDDRVRQTSKRSTILTSRIGTAARV